MTRLADDRAGQLSDDQVSDEIIKRLREEARTRADFSKVHACVPSSDIPDEKEARLVILGPDFPHANRDEKSAARREAAAILESRGSSPRNYKNTLVFLAGDVNRLREAFRALSGARPSLTPKVGTSSGSATRGFAPARRREL